MAVHAYPALLALGERRRQSIGGPTRWTVAGSLGLHLLFLLLVIAVRLPHIAERPASSYQVSLVTLRPIEASPVMPSVPQPPPREPPQEPTPAPQVRPATPKAAPPAPAKVVPPSPQRAPEVPKPLSIAKLSPLPVPDARKPSEAGQNLMKDVLRGIELPPEAPRLTESPTAAPAVVPEKPTSKNHDIENMMSKLTVPDITRKAPVGPVTEPAPQPMTRESIVQELEKLQRQLDAVQSSPPPPVSVQPSIAKPVPAPPPVSPTTSMRIDGIAAGSNSYFSRIQGLVSRHWAPPKVDLGGRDPKVVVKFRLHRSGAVSDVAIETSSGNDYYDAAGKRAVFSAAAAQLPPFPSGLSSAYVDVNFSFGIEPNAG